jgi:hypothetical protein
MDYPKDPLAGQVAICEGKRRPPILYSMEDEALKKFKQALLSSGLPLEYSAEGVLRRRQFESVSGDFAFIRAGAQGEMSIDLSAEKQIFCESLERKVGGSFETLRITANWDILVETKYRHDNVKWLFAPYEGTLNQSLLEYPVPPDGRSHAILGGPFASDAPVRQIGSQGLGRLHSALADAEQEFLETPICLRGIESRVTDKIEKHEAYSAEIRKAARQLQFAIVPFMWPFLRTIALRLRAGEYEPNRSHGELREESLELFSAYLVTTADIHILKPTASIEAIRNAKTIDDVAEAVPCVELATSPSNELVEHHRRILSETRNWPQLDLTSPSERKFFEQWEPMASLVEKLSPSIIVVGYKDFERCLAAHERSLSAYINISGRNWGKQHGYYGWV